jgi:hypothetical protein
MMTVKHSPLPWKLEGPSRTPRADTTGDFAIIAGGQIIGETFRQTGPTAFQPADANAALIVRAVNAHEELLALGDELVQSLHNELSEIEGTVAEPALREDIARVRAVLARIRNS